MVAKIIFQKVFPGEEFNWDSYNDWCFENPYLAYMHCFDIAVWLKDLKRIE